MKIRPQTEAAQAQNRTLALNQAEAVERGRFEQALMQAAQGVRDAEGDPYAGLTPQARQALSQALETLLGKSPSELRDLARQPGALAAFVADLGNGKSLNSAESDRLTRLVGLALPRILRSKSGAQDSGSADSTDQATAGQGKGFSAALAGLGTPSEGAAFASANEALASFQGGQAYVGAPAGFGGGAEPGTGLGAVGALEAGPLGGAGSFSGTVYTVSGGNAGGGAGTAGNAAGSVQGASTPPTRGPNQPQQGEGGTQGPPSEASGASTNGRSAAQASGSAAAGDGEEAGLPVDLDFQLVQPGGEWDAEPGSQVTLKGDDSWVQPQAAPVQGTRVPATQGPAAAAQSQGSGGPVQAAVASRADPAAGGPSLWSGAAWSPEPVGAEPGVSTGTGTAASARSGTGALAGLEQEAGEASQETAGPSDAVRLPGDGTQQNAGAPPASTGPGFQSPGAVLLSATQGLTGAARGGTGNGPEDAAPGSGEGSSGGRGNAAAVGSSTQTQRTPQGYGATAAVGQDAGQGNGAPDAETGAWPQGGPIPAGLAQVVAQSLNQSGPATPGRLLIQLSPSNLGAVQVELSLSDGKLTARLLAGQPDVRDALARDLSGFKAGLESHGVAVNEVSVALGSGGQNGPDQGSQRQDPRAPWRGRPAIPSGSAVEAAPTADWGSPYGNNAVGASQGFSALA